MGRAQKIIVGLDIGSTKVCTLIADSHLSPIGVGIAESKGIKKGSIVNIEAAVQSIRAIGFSPRRSPESLPVPP